jgi:hypothetical protein
MPNIVKDTLDEYILKNIVSNEKYDSYKTKEALDEVMQTNQLLGRQIDALVLNSRKMLADIRANTPQVNRS